MASPFVDQCDPNDALWNTSEGDREAILVTQPPRRERDEKERLRKEKQHDVLREKGVRGVDAERVHANLVAVD